MGQQRSLMLRSLVERSVHHKINGRRGFVPGHVALAEIGREVVVSCLRVRSCNVAKAARHPRLHSKSRKFIDDLLHLVRRNKSVLQADYIKANAGSAQGNFSLLVKAY